MASGAKCSTLYPPRLSSSNVYKPANKLFPIEALHGLPDSEAWSRIITVEASHGKFDRIWAICNGDPLDHMVQTSCCANVV